jgi:hypothetical protein
MKILVDKALRFLKKMPKIIKSIKKTENDEKNSNFNLGRNPLEIVHGPFRIFSKGTKMNHMIGLH